ncbi:MAG: hypothetical protein K2K29_01135, partial [Muribaculaceae bacterium]|nr:hypothetical protein [Muribaculaceae bacterium]
MKRRIIKNIIATFFLLLAALWITSCGEEPLAPAVPPDVMPEDGYITVRLACAEQSTRTSEPGLEALNENLIQSVTLCLWPRGGDWPDTREPYFMKTYTGLNLQDEAVIRIPLTEDLIAHLFNTDSSKTCNVYAAVNVDPGEADTPAALRNLAIGSSFAGSKVQEAFTMDGSAVAEYVTLMGAHAATAKIDLLRSAAKIDLHINVATEVKESPDGTTEHTWIPDLDGMVVMLNNGVMESTLTPDPADVSESALFNTPLDLTYNLTLSDSPADNHPAGVENYPYGMDAPFYTYPNEWDSSDPDSPGRTFMTLRIPWSDDGGASYKTCYYRVPVVAPAFDELVRNTSYHVLLDVSVLGSFVPDEPMPVTDLTYTAAEWGVENLDVEITEPRYLVVNQHDYDVNNLSDISIPFYTSHETIVTDIKMTFYRFNYSDAGLKFPVEVTMQRNELSRQRTGEPVFTYSFDNTTDMLNVSHDLVMYDAYRGTGNGTEVSLTNRDGPTSNRAKYYSTQDIVTRLNDPTTGIQWFKKKLTNGLTEDEF